MLRSVLLAAAAVAALSACTTAADTTAEAPAGRDCFNSNSVSGFSPIDDHHVKLSVGASRDYALTTSYRINEVRFTQEIGIRSTTNWICTGNGLGVELLVPNAIPDRYPVTEIVRLPEEPVTPPQGS